MREVCDFCDFCDFCDLFTESRFDFYDVGKNRLPKFLTLFLKTCQQFHKTVFEIS